MEFPKINYDDFYKFLMSLGTVLVFGSSIGIFVLKIKEINLWWSLIFVLVIIISIIAMIWAGFRWYKNQGNIDRKIAAETKLTEGEASRIISASEISSESSIPKRVSGRVQKIAKEESGVAIVSYLIASVLPNSIPLSLLKDGKVWFWISNHEKKKYLAYIKVKFFIDDILVKELNDGYYGGIKPWNLNALIGIQAPGLGIPEGVREAAKQGKRVKIQVDCKIHDEDNKLIEEKLPQSYVYDAKNNSWFLEP